MDLISVVMRKLEYNKMGGLNERNIEGKWNNWGKVRIGNVVKKRDGDGIILCLFSCLYVEVRKWVKRKEEREKRSERKRGARGSGRRIIQNTEECGGPLVLLWVGLLRLPSNFIIILTRGWECGPLAPHFLLQLNLLYYIIQLTFI